MTALGVVALAGAATYLLRAGTVAYVARRDVPATGERLLRVVAPATMAAIVAAGLATQAQDLDAAEIVPRATALVVGVVVTLRTRRPAVAIGVGLPVAWVTALLVAAAG